MNPALSPAGERAATLAFDKQFDEQAALIRLETWQNATERTPPAKGTATSLLQRFLYWLYERRLLDLLKRRPMPRHIGIILDGNRRHARKGGLSQRSPVCACSLVSSLLLSGPTMSQQSSLTQSAHSVRQVLTAYRLNMKNSDAPAVKREEQEDYGQEPDHELWAEK